MTLIAIILLAYLFVAPDKGTLAATRGTEGAFRAAFGMPPRQRRAAKGSSRKGSSGSKATGSGASRSLLDGWREGVSSARVAREEGRDAWSRTSRGAGRVAGGTRNVVGGIRTTYRNRRDRRQSITTTPDTQTTVVDPTTTATGNDHQVDDVADQRPTDAVNETDDAPQQDGTLLFSSKNDDLGAAIGESVHPDPKAGELNELVDDQVPDEAPVTVGEVAEEPPADDRYYVWKSPVSGQFFVFDRLNLDEPLPCTDERAAELWTDFYNDRHGLATQNGEPATALSDLPGRGGPYDPTPVVIPATDNPGTTPRKESAMAIAGSELANLDEVAGEVKAASAEVEQLGVALDALKSWAANLTDRWSGTSWSTDGLDASIAGVAEAAAELKRPDGVMDQLAAINNEITKARSVGEAAEAARAKGDLKGFVPA